MQVQELLTNAMEHHRAGRLTEAAELYQRALAIERDQPDALNLLAVLARQERRFDQAIALATRAVAARPRAADYRLNLGEALRAVGRLDEAVAAYRDALQLRADDADAHFGLGMALARLDRLDEAIAAFGRAIELRWAHVAAHEERGACLARLGRFDEAIASCRRAVTLQPRRPEAHFKLGAVLTAARRLGDAIGAYQRAIELRPDWAMAYAGLSQAQGMLFRSRDAEASSRKAIALDPKLGAAYNHLGLALVWQGRASEAVEAYRTCIELLPTFAEPWANMGWALVQSLEHDAAIAAYRRAIELAPGDAGAAHSNLLFALNYVDSITREQLLAEHRAWAERVLSQIDGRSLHGCSTAASARGVADMGIAGMCAANVSPARVGNPCHGGASHAAHRVSRPLRVGYVSPDLCEHPVAYFVEPILAGHDRAAVEPIVYSDALRADGVTRRLRSLATTWNDTAGMTDEQLAQRVRDDGIHILVDLAGHTARNRLRMFASRPAPVQVTYLGYPNTTGLPASIINYRITDDICDSPDSAADAHHTERLIRLPAPFLCYQPPRESPEVVPPPSLKSGIITFGCFNGMMKVTERMLGQWCEVLRRVPHSQLLLKNRSLADPVLHQRVRDVMSSQRIEPDRVRLSGMEASHFDHLARYGEVDIALDTFPYHGTTTTCESLWMGVPVVTLIGNVHRSRVGLTLLSGVGLSDLASRSCDDYVTTAVGLAQDGQRLSRLRKELRNRVADSGLCQRERFVRHLERAYAGIFASSA